MKKLLIVLASLVMMSAIPLTTLAAPPDSDIDYNVESNGKIYDAVVYSQQGLQTAVEAAQTKGPDIVYSIGLGADIGLKDLSKITSSIGAAVQITNADIILEPLNGSRIYMDWPASPTYTTVRMFSVTGGAKLTICGITLDGCKATKANVKNCTLIQAESSEVIVGKDTVLTGAFATSLGAVSASAASVQIEDAVIKKMIPVD